ncbi:carcinoembryonic antigen-related cell adhesion molecule 1 [Pholidichthys leucotaenia]
MEFPVVLVLLAAITCADGRIHASENPIPVGHNLTLHSNQSITAGAWLFDNNIIRFVFPNGGFTSEDWEGRINYDPATSSLTIYSLTLGDSGEYVLHGQNFLSEITVSVQEIISGVAITATETSLVEFNDTAVLMCSVSNGTSLSYQWLNGSSEVTAAGNVQLSNENATLTIIDVTQYDQGPFRCRVSNGVSNGTSSSVNLSVSYGPKNIKMDITPKQEVYKTGSNITLFCSVDAHPQASVQWFHNGISLTHGDNQYQVENAAESDSGNYKCLFHSNVTLRFASASEMLKIWGVEVGASMIKAIEGHSYNLTCSVTEADVQIYWMKDGQPLHEDDSTVFHMDNTTVCFSPVDEHDTGSYTCMAKNVFGNVTSDPHTLIVNYGPRTPVIYGPAFVEEGHYGTFNCSASSEPPSNYTWWFNGSEVANTFELKVGPLFSNMSGEEYTCMAHNDVTGKNSTKSTTLKVGVLIKDVQVEKPTAPAIEGEAYNLTCNVNGPADYIYWMKDGEPLHEDNRTEFYMENQTLSFNPVKRHDAGNYTCVAKNAFGKMNSDPYQLHVNFGPDSPIIHGPKYVVEGDSPVFKCSAVSKPPSHFTWWFNGSQVANTSQFQTDILHLNMSRQYTCVAHNDLTGKNSSASTTPIVIEAIQSVTIRNNSIPIDKKNFTLICDVTGPYDKVYWMKDSKMLHMNGSHTSSHMSYHVEENMLHFTPLTLSSEGLYQCVVSNLAHQEERAEYELVVNYGPLSIELSYEVNLSNEPTIDLNIVATCTADSRPDSDIFWYLNNQLIGERKGSISIPLASYRPEWNLTCKAYNPVTHYWMDKTVTGSTSAVHFSHQSSLLLTALLALSASMLFD